MRKIILWLVLILLCFTGLGCSTLNDFFNSPPEPDVEAEFVGNLGGLGDKMLNILEVEDGLPADFVLGEIGLKLTMDDKKFLRDKCGDCHVPNRVFLKRCVSCVMWEELWKEDKHQKLELTQAEKDRVVELFKINQAEEPIKSTPATASH